MLKRLNTKRNSILSIISFSLITIVLVSYFIHHRSRLDTISKDQIPLQRLITDVLEKHHSLSNLTLKLTQDYSEKQWQQYKLQRGSHAFHIASLTREMSKNSPEIKKEFFIDRSLVNAYEDQMLNLIKEENFKAALMIYLDPKYQNSKSQYESNLIKLNQSILEVTRNSILTNLQFNTKALAAIFFISLCTLILYFHNILKINKLIKHNFRVSGKLAREKHRSSYYNRMASLGETASGLIYEVKNPLSIIEGYCETLIQVTKKNTIDKVRLIDTVSRIRKTTKRIATTLNSLENLSRDNSESDKQIEDISDITEQTINLYREKLKVQGIDFTFSNRLPGRSLVQIHRNEISQALLNLINNSYEALTDNISSCDEERKWLRVELKSNSEFITCSVIDSGNGIPKLLADKIMDPFFSTKGSQRSTGLGLSIARQIINEHGGELKIDQSSRNTKFDILLPLYKEAEKEPMKVG